MADQEPVTGAASGRGIALPDGLYPAFATPLPVRRFGDADGVNERLAEAIIARAWARMAR